MNIKEIREIVDAISGSSITQFLYENCKNTLHLVNVPPTQQPPVQEAISSAELINVISPYVGRVRYHDSEEQVVGEPRLVCVGDIVEPRQELAFVCAVGVHNAIRVPPDFRGIVREVHYPTRYSDGYETIVEYGELLFVLEVLERIEQKEEK